MAKMIFGMTENRHFLQTCEWKPIYYSGLVRERFWNFGMTENR